MRALLTSKEIGEKLKDFRKRKGMTLEQLAEAVGVTVQAIQQYENGKARMNTDKLQAVALALSIPVAAFFGEVEGPLSPDEQELLNGFRGLTTRDLRAFVLHALAYKKKG